MNRIIRIYYVKRKKLLITIALCIPIIFAALLIFDLVTGRAVSYNDPGTGIIVVDPGHGGIDGGTGAAGFLEKEINLSIAKKLKVLLEKEGYKVVMTRSADESLEDLIPGGGGRHYRDLEARAEIINSSEAQLFLSIHVNANVNNPRACGSITYYSTRFSQSEALADCIQDSLNGLDAGPFERTAHAPQKASFYILNTSKMPGVLIETGFITNHEERRLLATDEFRDKLAAGIVDGVTAYYAKAGLSKPEAAGKPAL